MRMTRKIRRAWLRGKPEWAKCYLLKQRLRKQNKVKSLEEHKNRLHGYSRYLVAGVILACLGMGQSIASASEITASTGVTNNVVKTGNVYDIYNQQVNNGSALNKFDKFNLSSSDIANLQLDEHTVNGVTYNAADRQINLVNNKVAIDGVLNAYKNGQIGGDIYFFSDKGIAIGSTGVVNVGSLTLGTSVSAGQKIYDDFTSYNNKYKSSLEKAKYIAGEGDISIGGSINTADNITIGAKSLTASGDAKINSGIDFSKVSTTKSSGQSMSDYRAQFMNLGGANKDALAVISKGDEIVLYGQSGVEFSSKDYVSITGTSANNIKVASNGGDVEVRVNASDNVNAKVSVEHAQITSNGGDINVSLINDVRDDVEIDIKNSTLDATTSNVNNANGNVSISASTVAEVLSWAQYGNSATVNVTDYSVVKGDNVNVTAIASVSGKVDSDVENNATDKEFEDSLKKVLDEDSTIIDDVYNLSGYDISELRSFVTVTNTEARSIVNITDSDLEAVGVTKVVESDTKVVESDTKVVESDKETAHGCINVYTEANSEIITTGIGLINFSFTFGQSDAISKIKINNSNLKANDDIDINAYGKNKIDQSYLELSFLSGKVPGTIAFNWADLNSDVGVTINSDSDLNALGDVSIDSKSVRSLTNAPCAGGSINELGLSAAVTMADTKAITDVQGDIYADGGISVSALNTLYKEDGENTYYEQDTSTAESYSGDSFLGKAFSGLTFKILPELIITKVLKKKNSKINLKELPGKDKNFSLNAATAVLITDSQAQASVTGNVAGWEKEKANSLKVSAETISRVKVNAMAYQNARTSADGSVSAQDDKTGALAINVGFVENNAVAFVGGTNNETKTKDLNIEAKNTIPWQTSWSDDSGLGITLNIFFASLSKTSGLDELVDSWAQSNNNSKEVGGAGAVTYIDYTNDADAYIAENAKITVDNEINIEAINDIATVNFNGIVSSFFNKIPYAAAWEKVSSVFKNNVWGTNAESGTAGGAVALIYHNNDANAYVSDGAKISTKTLDVDAKNQTVDVVIVGNGGASDNVALDGAAGVINTQNSVNAYIGQADVKASDDVFVDALDDTLVLSLGGTIVKSGAMGIGATVAYTQIERDTNAFINGNVNAGDEVVINAKNTGEIVSASIAGSITSKSNQTNAAGSEIAFGAAANTAFNDVKDKASAYIATVKDTSSSGSEVNKASVVAKSIKVKSINDTEIAAAALTASVNTKAGVSTGIAGSYMQNSIISNNKAYLDDVIVTLAGTTSSNKDEALQIEATNEENIINISVGGSVAPKGNNVLGQVSNNILESNTQAYIKDSTVKNDDVTTVKAYDDQDVLLVSGAVTVSGSYVGVGAAVGVQQITADTSAFVKDSTFNGVSEKSTKGGDINVVAEEKTDAFAIVATGSFGGSNAFASADSSGTNIVNTETKAYIENAVNLNASGIVVTAQNIANSTLGVGGISQSKNAVGVSLANNLSANLVEAYVQGDTNNTKVITADSLSINASNIYNGSADKKTDDSTTENAETSSNAVATTENTGDANTDTLDSYEEVLDYLFTNEYDETTAKTVAVGAAIANNTLAGVGSEVLNQITNTTKAHLDEGEYSVTGGLNVDAQSKAYIFGLAGGLSAAKNVGIGASVDYEDIDIKTEAYVGDKVNIDKAGSITVKAESIEDITSIAVSAGGGKYFAGAFNAGIHDIKVDTSAHIGNENATENDESDIGIIGTNETSTVGKITIEAKDDAKLSANAGGGTLHVSGAGVASSLGAAVEVLEKNVSAYIGKANIVANEIDIDAINQGEIINTASELAIAVSNGVGLSGAASENFVTQNTKAYVANESQITIIENNSGTSTADSNSSDGNSTNNNAIGVNGISIKAQGNFKSLPVVVGAGVGSLAAGGGAHAYMDFEGNTSAYVGYGATINAGKKLEILAENDLAVTVGEGAAAGSKYVSGNGAIGLVDVDNSTRAWIGEQSNVTAQADGITVKADDYTKVETYNETLGGSQYASVGAAIQVNNISKDTQAYIKKDAVLNSKGNVVVNAESSEDLFNNATQADGAQYAGAGASVIVNDLELVTKAFTDTGVKIYSGNLTITAHHLLDNDNVAVGVAGSQYANVGAGVDVTTVSSHVNAYLGDGNVIKGKGDLNVVANEELGTANDHMISTAVGASGAEYGSGNGSVSVGTFNSAMSDDTKNLLNSLDGTSFNAWVSENVQEATNVSEALDEYEDNTVVSAVEIIVDSNKYEYDITGAPSTSGSAGVLSKIGQSAKVIANSVNVDADDNLYYEVNAGSGSAAVVAGGAVVAVVESDTTTKALIDDNVQLKVKGAVTVDGKINHNLVDATIVGANVSGFGGAYTSLYWTDSSDVSAVLKASKINADSLSIHSDNIRKMMNDNESTALIGATIGNTGNGVVFEAEIGGSSIAEIKRDDSSNLSVINTSDETEVFAEANTDLDVIAIAPSGGGIAGAGTSVKLNSNVAVNTNVYNAKISAEKITVNATTTPKLYALATADVIGGTAVGLTLSEVKIEDDVTVNVGDGVVLNADDTIDILAEFKNPEAGYNAYVEAIAGSGGVITGAVTVTNITMDTKSVVNIGKSNNISAQSLSVLSKHEDSFNYQNLSIGAAGASGLGSENTVNIISDSTVNIADDETVNINGEDASADATNISTIGNVSIKAENKTNKDWLNAINDSDVNYNDYNALSAGASVSGGTGIVNSTDIKHTTNVNMGNVVVKANVSDPNDNNSNANSESNVISIDAYSYVKSKDYQYIGTGAVLEAAQINDDNKVIANTNVNIKSGTKLYAGDVDELKEPPSYESVVIGNNSSEDLKGGNISIGSRNDADMYSKTYVNTWGGAGIVGTTNDVTYEGFANTNFGGVAETANGDVRLAAGYDSASGSNLINVTADSNIINGTVIPISHTDDPVAIVKSNSKLTMTGGEIKSDADVYLKSNAGTINALGTGEIYDWVHAVGAWFDSTSWQTGADSIETSADVEVNGTIETGIHRNQSITIGGNNLDENGDYTSNWYTKVQKTNGISFIYYSAQEVRNELSEQLEKLRELRAEYIADYNTVQIYDNEIKLIQDQMEVLGLGYYEGSTFVEYDHSNTTNTIDTKLLLNDAQISKIQKAANYFSDLASSAETNSVDATKYSKVATKLKAIVKEKTAAKDAFKNAGGTLSDGQYVDRDGNECNAYSVTGSNYTFSNVTLSDIASSLPKTKVELNDITVKLGDIIVEADNLYGTGKLHAMADANVSIINNSPNDLVVNDIKVVGSRTEENKYYNGASITFNSINVSSNEDINSYNEDASKTVAFTEIKNNTNTSANVTIQNIFDPKVYTVRALGTNTTTNADLDEKLFSASNVTIASDAQIYNPYGNVSVTSSYGDVYNYGTIDAKSVNVHVNNGSYVQEVDDDSRIVNIGGDPGAIYDSQHDNNPDTNTTLTSGIYANGNIVIKARYVNINSTIQSGKADCEFTIPQSYELYYYGNDGQKVMCTDINNVATNTTLYVDGCDDYVVYDTSSDSFVLEGLDFQGGSVDITGTILNTSKGNGKIIALDGYGTVDVLNNTDKDLIIRDVSTGVGVEGVIKITDLDRETGAVIRTTTYTRSGDKVLVNGIDAETEQVTYTPERNYYIWQSGQDTSTVTEYHYTDSDAVIWWKDGTFSDKELEDMDVVSITTGENLPLENGTLVTGSEEIKLYDRTGHEVDVTAESSASVKYYDKNGAEVLVSQIETSNEDGYKKYVYTYTTSTSDPYDERTETHRVWYTLWIQKEYDHWFKIKEGTTTITQKSLKADNPIDIKFIGDEANGTLSINGGSGNVILNGLISNAEGTTTISGKSITQVGNGYIKADVLNLVAKEGSVGSIDNPVDTTANKLTGKGDVFAVDVLQGDVVLGGITATNKAYLNVAGDINQVAGTTVSANRVELYSQSGGISGSERNALNISVGAPSDYAKNADYGLKASAIGDINIVNTSGDLYLDSVIAKKGDVTLSTTGSFIDNNFSDVVDKTAAEKLTQWANAQILEGQETTADFQKQLLIIMAQNKYNRYQALKESISVDEDGNVEFSLNDIEKEALRKAGYDDEAINKYAATKVDEYKALVSEGAANWTEQNLQDYKDAIKALKASDDLMADANLESVSDEHRFVANSGVEFLTAKEKDQVLVGSARSKQEMLVTNGPGALKEVTDTNLLIKETPNIKGNNVTLSKYAGENNAIGSTKSISGTIVPENIVAILEKDASKWTVEEKQELALYEAYCAAERGDVSINNGALNVKVSKPIVIEASGAINAVGFGGDVLLASESDVHIDKISSGGEVRIKANGSIIGSVDDKNQTTGNSGKITSGERVILESAQGCISGITLIEGTDSSTNEHHELIARANNDIVISKAGELAVDTIYSAQGTVSFNVSDSDGNRNDIISYIPELSGLLGYGLNDSQLNIKAVNVTLNGVSNLGTSSKGVYIDVNGGKLTIENTENINILLDGTMGYAAVNGDNINLINLATIYDGSFAANNFMLDNEVLYDEDGEVKVKGTVKAGEFAGNIINVRNAGDILGGSLIAQDSVTINVVTGETTTSNLIVEAKNDVEISTPTDISLTGVKASNLEVITDASLYVNAGEINNSAELKATNDVVVGSMKSNSLIVNAGNDFSGTTIVGNDIDIQVGNDIVVSTKDVVNSLVGVVSQQPVSVGTTTDKGAFNAKVSTDNTTFADNKGDGILRSTGTLRLSAQDTIAVDTLEINNGVLNNISANVVGIDDLQNNSFDDTRITITGSQGEALYYVGIGTSDANVLQIVDSKINNVYLDANDNAGLQNVVLQDKAILKVGDVLVSVNNDSTAAGSLSVEDLYISGNDIRTNHAFITSDKSLTINGSHRTPTAESVAEEALKVAENNDEKFRDTVLADVVKEINQNYVDAYGKPKEQHQDIEFTEYQPIIDGEAAVAEQMIIVSGNGFKKTAETASENRIGNEDDKEDRK